MCRGPSSAADWIRLGYSWTTIILLRRAFVNKTNTLFLQRTHIEADGKNQGVSPNFATPSYLFEETESDGVDVLVIRQRTTKRSGYHTNPKKSAYVVNTTLDLARRLLGS